MAFTVVVAVVTGDYVSDRSGDDCEDESDVVSSVVDTANVNRITHSAIPTQTVDNCFTKKDT